MAERSSGGSISLRLSLAGSEQVREALASLGPAGARAMRQIEEAHAGPNAAMRGLNAAGGELNKTIDGMAERAGSLGEVFGKMGPAGMAAAAAIGLIVAALAKAAEMGAKSAEWAEALKNAAEKLGETTSAVQAFDYAALSGGVSIEAMRAGLLNLNEVLGRVQDNLMRGKTNVQVKAFAAIGLTPEDLKNFQSGSELLLEIADRIQHVRTEAEKAAIAKALGLEDLLPLLKQGRGALQAYLDEAQRGGAVVAPQLVEQTAKLNDQMKAADQRASAAANTLGTMFVPALVAVKNAAADAMQWLAKLFNLNLSPTDDLVNHLRAGAQAQARADAIRQHPGALNAQMVEQQAGVFEQQARDEFAAAHAITSARMMGAGVSNGLPRPSGTYTFHDNPPAGGGGGRGPRGPTPEEIAANGQNALDAANKEVLDAKRAELQAELVLATTAAARAALQKQIADLDQQQADAALARKHTELDLQLQQRKITQAAHDGASAQLDAAGLERQKVDQLKKQLDARTEAIANEQEQARLTAIDAQGQEEMLRAQLALTTDRKKRRDIELQLYDIAQQQLAAAQLDVLKNPASTEAQVREAQKQLGNIYGSYDTGRNAILRGTQDPWSAKITEMRGSLLSINDEFGSIAAQGLDRFNEGLVDASGRVANMGDLLRQAFQQALTALEAYLVKQAEIAVLGGGSGGNSGGGIGSMILNAVLSSFGGGGMKLGAGPSTMGLPLPGFAGGGSPWVVRGPGTGTSDGVFAFLSNLESVNSAAATRAYWPVIEQMNKGTLPIPHMAGGGLPAGTGGAGASLGLGGVHFHKGAFDMSINAPGADPAQLGRVATAQENFARNEPVRWAAYYKALGRR